MYNKFDYIDNELKRLEEENLIRKHNCFTSSQDIRSIIKNEEMLLFSSSNYLSIMQREDIMEKAYDDSRKYGMGSGGSRLTTGNSMLHERLEGKIAEFTGYESAIIFSSGYCANVGVISAVADKNTVIFSDMKNHASIIDGCRLSGAEIVKYRHIDMKDLEDKLKLYKDRRKVIISDGVFSMDGDILNLPEFVELSDKYSATSIVDDAHGFGVIGEHGRGICENYNNKYHPDILIGTLSKAIGSEGGFAATTEKMKKYLQNKARTYIFSTSLSPYVVSSSYYVIDYLLKNNEYVKALHENIDYFVNELNNAGIDVKSSTPIIRVNIGDEKKAVDVSKKLLDKKLYVSAIRYPTVEKNRAMLRITVMRNHKKEDLDLLVRELAKLKYEYQF